MLPKSQGTMKPPVALTIFYFNNCDFLKTVIGYTNFWGDCDSIAAIGSEIAGVFKGIDVIPIKWLKRINEENPTDNLE